MQIAKDLGIPKEQAVELINYSKIPIKQIKEDKKIKDRLEKYNLVKH